VDESLDCRHIYARNVRLVINYFATILDNESAEASSARRIRQSAESVAIVASSDAAAGV
jgi:hypothetical protein